MGYGASGAAYEAEPRDPLESTGELGAYITLKRNLDSYPQRRALYDYLIDSIEAGALGEHVLTMFDHRPTMGYQYGLAMLRAGVISVGMKHDRTFPVWVESADDYRRAVEDHLDEFSEDSAELEIALRSQEVGSSRHRRADAIKLVLLASGISGGDLVEAGSGQGHNLKRLAADSGYGETLAVDAFRKQDRKIVSETINYPLSTAINRALSEVPFNMSYGLGIDLSSPEDVIPSRFARASVPRLESPVTDATALREFDELAQDWPENMATMFPKDLNEPWQSEEDFWNDAESKKVDLPEDFAARAAFFSYSYYQMRGNKGRKTALDNMRKLPTAEGFRMFVLDAVKIQPKKKMRFEDHREPYVHALYEVITRKRSFDFKRLMTIKDGDISAARLEPAFWELPLAAELLEVSKAKVRQLRAA